MQRKMQTDTDALALDTGITTSLEYPREMCRGNWKNVTFMSNMLYYIFNGMNCEELDVCILFSRLLPVLGILAELRIVKLAFSG